MPSDQNKRNPNIWIMYDEAEQKWEVRRENTDKPMSLHRTKDEAVEAGREIARRENGELTITGEDQRIQDRDSYGNDPFPPRDTRH